MPTTYAHDLFGKRVYQRLPEEMRRVIRKHGNLYRIGLHGPDILFYFLICKNPVSHYGVSMHRQKARDFFERAMSRAREKKDEALLAYTLGFGCHYLLDSACHPFVDEMDREHVISHALLELEFDRVLMGETGKNPFSFYPSDAIVPRYRYARVIHDAIPAVCTPVLYLTLPMMKRSTNSLVCDDGGRRREFLAKIASFAGAKKERFIKDHFMAPEVSPQSGEPVRKLKELFDKTIAEAPRELFQLYGLYEKPGALSPRWNLTYNG